MEIIEKRLFILGGQGNSQQAKEKLALVSFMMWDTEFMINSPEEILRLSQSWRQMQQLEERILYVDNKFESSNFGRNIIQEHEDEKGDICLTELGTIKLEKNNNQDLIQFINQKIINKHNREKQLYEIYWKVFKVNRNYQPKKKALTKLGQPQVIGDSLDKNKKLISQGNITNNLVMSIIEGQVHNKSRRSQSNFSYKRLQSITSENNQNSSQGNVKEVDQSDESLTEFPIPSIVDFNNQSELAMISRSKQRPSPLNKSPRKQFYRTNSIKSPMTSLSVQEKQQKQSLFRIQTKRNILPEQPLNMSPPVQQKDNKLKFNLLNKQVFKQKLEDFGFIKRKQNKFCIYFSNKRCGQLFSISILPGNIVRFQENSQIYSCPVSLNVNMITHKNLITLISQLFNSNHQILRNFVLQNAANKMKKRQKNLQINKVFPETQMNSNLLQVNMTKECVFKIDIIHTVKMSLISQNELLQKEMHYINNKFIYKVKGFGRSIVDFHLYIQKSDISNVHQPFLICLDISPYESKTVNSKIILGYHDLMQINEEACAEFNNNYNVKQQKKILEIILDKSIAISTLIGKIIVIRSQVQTSITNSRKRANIFGVNNFEILKKSNGNQKSQFGIDLQIEKLTINKPILEKYAFLQEDKSKQQKQLLNKTIFCRRIIIRQIMKIGRQFWIITITRDVILKTWIVNLYCSHTQRQFQGSFNIDQLSESFISKLNETQYLVSQKIQFYIDNDILNPFDNYNHFVQRVLNKSQNIILGEKYEKLSQAKSKKNLQQALQTYKISLAFAQLDNKNNKKFNLKMQFIKNVQLIPTYTNKQISKFLIKQIRPQQRNGQTKQRCSIMLSSIAKKYIQVLRMKKMNRQISLSKKNDYDTMLQYLKKITYQQDIFFQDLQFNQRYLFINKFIEIYLWSSLFNTSFLNLQKETCSIWSYNLKLRETLFSQPFKIENQKVFNIDVQIDLTNLMQHNERQGSRILQSKNIKKDSQMLKTVEMINYRDTTQLIFSIGLKNYYHNYEQKIELNFREILNVFIGEGFFSDQSNYLNAKLNYSDIRMMSFFIFQKFSSGHFMDLIEEEDRNASDIQQIHRNSIVNEMKKTIRNNLVLTSIQHHPIIKINQWVDIKKKLCVTALLYTRDNSFKFILTKIGTRDQVTIFKEIQNVEKDLNHINVLIVEKQIHKEIIRRLIKLYTPKLVAQFKECYY